MKQTTTKDIRPGYTVHRFQDDVGFALGFDSHDVWLTWRMDGEFHAHPTIRRFATQELARNDLADRIRFYRLLINAKVATPLPIDRVSDMPLNTA